MKSRKVHVVWVLLGACLLATLLTGAAGPICNGDGHCPVVRIAFALIGVSNYRADTTGQHHARGRR